jgi:hypothetical protein
MHNLKKTKTYKQLKKLFKYSRFLHWMTFLCLCLPFFYTGCKKADAPATEAVQVDSTSLNLEKVDTVAINKVASQPQKSIDKAESKTEENEETLSETLSQEYTFLQPILVSKKNTFSGLAILIDCGSDIVFFGMFIYVLLSILSLTIKYLDSNGIKTIVLLEVLSLFFLVISRPFGLFYNNLWGLWVAIILFSTVTILDIYILTKYHLTKRKDCA